jgi:hypothetical protein
MGHCSILTFDGPENVLMGMNAPNPTEKSQSIENHEKLSNIQS